MTAQVDFDRSWLAASGEGWVGRYLVGDNCGADYDSDRDECPTANASTP